MVRFLYIIKKTIMKELIFSLAFFFTNGNIMDTNLKLHKYDKQNFKKFIFQKIRTQLMSSASNILNQRV